MTIRPRSATASFAEISGQIGPGIRLAAGITHIRQTYSPPYGPLPLIRGCGACSCCGVCGRKGSVFPYILLFFGWVFELRPLSLAPLIDRGVVRGARRRPVCGGARGAGSRHSSEPTASVAGSCMEGNMSQSTAVASRSRSRSRSPERGAGVLNQAGRSGELNGASHSTEFRAGDWQCRSCGRHVYGSRAECKCGQPKALNAAPVAQGPFAANSRPGDWLCPSCGVVVYASKALPPP